MSSGPVVTVRSSATVSVIASTAPRDVATNVVTTGPQGPMGLQGPRGLPGYAKRFGTIDFTDNDQGTPFVLPPMQWMRIARNLAPSTANFNLPSGPWDGFSFWDNTTKMLKARMRGDVLLFKFSYIVVPDQRGGGLRFSVRPADDINFEFGPDPIALVVDAGQTQPGSETFQEQCRSRFVDVGATVYVMAPYGATMLEFSPEVTPLDFATP